MKKFFTLVTTVLVGACGYAEAQDVNVTVSQDSIPAVPYSNEITADPTSNAIVAEAEEEENLFDGNKKDYGKSIAKTWEWRVFGTLNTTSGTSSITSDESGAFEIGVGYNPTSWFYAGATTGFWHDWGGTSGLPAGDIIPFLADLQFRWNVKRKVSLYIEGRTGVFCNVTPDHINQSHEIDFEYPNYMYYEVQPGILFRLTEKLDMRVSIGYGYAKPYNEFDTQEYRTYDETVITGKFGFSYRFR